MSPLAGNVIRDIYLINCVSESTHSSYSKFFAERLLEDERVTGVLSEEEIRSTSNPFATLSIGPELVEQPFDDTKE